MSDHVAEGVLARNRVFYDAFEAADLDAMSELWEHSDRASCTHPGWATLRGWSDIAASWFAIFQNPVRQQVILTNENVTVLGDVAWVTLDENLIDVGTQGTIAATNIFVLEKATWSMVNHHGSPVMRTQ